MHREHFASSRTTRSFRRGLIFSRTGGHHKIAPLDQIGRHAAAKLIGRTQLGYEALPQHCIAHVRRIQKSNQFAVEPCDDLRGGA